MTSNAQLPVTVAVAGDEDGALAYAVAEARRTGSPLRLVHAVEQVPIAASMVPLVSYDDLELAAEKILDQAADVVRSLAGDDVVVEAVVRRGHAAHVLIDESETARLMVLEHRALHRLVRVFTGSTSTAVAARAHCPVVSVPETWAPGIDHHEVVVGVDDTCEPASALDAAFAEADRREASLRVLHAWRLASPYDPALETGVEEEWRQRTEPGIQQAVEEREVEFPHVKATVELRYAAPADTLAHASKTADVLVIGRRTRRGRLWIGSIARALTRVSECPVMVVPAPELKDSDGQWHLDADDISPQS
jgi:nucleotide-binding universal stress UspA family protein